MPFSIIAPFSNTMIVSNLKVEKMRWVIIIAVFSCRYLFKLLNISNSVFASTALKQSSNTTISGSFISRIQSTTHPTIGYAPLLGISQQSIINSIITGQMTEYKY